MICSRQASWVYELVNVLGTVEVYATALVFLWPKTEDDAASDSLQQSSNEDHFQGNKFSLNCN